MIIYSELIAMTLVLLSAPLLIVHALYIMLCWSIFIVYFSMHIYRMAWEHCYNLNICVSQVKADTASGC